jgi:predicted transcriptional regulator
LSKTPKYGIITPNNHTYLGGEHLADSPLKKRKDSEMHRERVVPSPNPDGYGKRWLWDAKKELAVELLAKGYSYEKTGNAIGVTRRVVESWFRIPEFAQAVDHEIMEIGMANKQARIATMKSMADRLLEIFELKVEDLMVSANARSDERVKEISSEIRDLLKQIAQEKEEYVEISRQEHVGEVAVAADVSNIETYLQGLKDDARVALEKEFANVADAVVAQITQGLPQPVEKPKPKDE